VAVGGTIDHERLRWPWESERRVQSSAVQLIDKFAIPSWAVGVGKFSNGAPQPFVIPDVCGSQFDNILCDEVPVHNESAAPATRRRAGPAICPGHQQKYQSCTLSAFSSAIYPIAFGSSYDTTSMTSQRIMDIPVTGYDLVTGLGIRTEQP